MRSCDAEDVAAYAIFEVVLRDDASSDALLAYERYRAAVPSLVERFGGRYLARAWPGRALEGAAAGDRFHLIEFPDAAAADAFWTSSDYRELQRDRADAATIRAVVISPAGP